MCQAVRGFPGLDHAARSGEGGSRAHGRSGARGEGGGGETVRRDAPARRRARQHLRVAHKHKARPSGARAPLRRALARRVGARGRSRLAALRRWPVVARRRRRAHAVPGAPGDRRRRGGRSQGRAHRGRRARTGRRAGFEARRRQMGRGGRARAPGRARAGSRHGDGAPGAAERACIPAPGRGSRGRRAERVAPRARRDFLAAGKSPRR